MTPFERRLGVGVIASWMLLSVCTSALRIGGRIVAHRPISLPGASFFEWEWLLEGFAAAAFAIYVWRSRDSRFRLAKTAGVAMLLFLLFEICGFGSWLLLRKLLPNGSIPVSVMLNAMLTIDITHFFILILGTAPVVVMIDAYRKGNAAERDAAQLEATLAEARLRKVRNEVQPDLIRQSLAGIEALLPFDAVRAEAELLNLSDVLRAALLQTTVRGAAEERHEMEIAR